MKKRFAKQLLSFTLAGVLAFSNVPVTVQAANNQTEGAETISGAPETIQIQGNIQGAREMNFNEGWKFNLGDSSTAQNPGFNDSDWDDVTLPHDFSITQSYTTRGEAESGFLPGGTGWYRKKFVLPESYAEKRKVLNFDGVYSDAYVYVNAQQACLG